MVIIKLSWDKDKIQGLKITQSWLNKSEKGEGHHNHTHRLSILSGVLYLTEPTMTKFLIPSLYTLPSIIAPGPITKVNKIITKMSAKKGTLLIIPSWIEHGVDENINERAHYKRRGCLTKSEVYVFDDKKINISNQINKKKIINFKQIKSKSQRTC